MKRFSGGFLKRMVKKEWGSRVAYASRRRRLSRPSFPSSDARAPYSLMNISASWCEWKAKTKAMFALQRDTVESLESF